MLPVPETDTEALRSKLRTWYRRVGRDLPWRRTVDPYAIWVSEIMLQQTQVPTALPYYERWMLRFPTVEALAGSSEQDALSLWQGLGYYRRCNNLLLGAQYVAASGFPESFEDWLKVPGVGRYTAAAIASICLGERVGVVDGNVERVFARLTECDLTGSSLHRAAWTWARGAVDPDFPAEWNQAVMELGATVCTPKNPACGRCPVSDGCAALRKGTVADLPRRAPKKEVDSLEFAVWVPYFKGSFGLTQIEDGPWWRGMWEFCRTALDEVPAWVGAQTVALHRVKHTVTHHRIELSPYLVLLDLPASELIWFDRKELVELPIPAPQRRILEAASKAIGLMEKEGTETLRHRAAGR